jgi:hypothetical protein
MHRIWFPYRQINADRPKSTPAFLTAIAQHSLEEFCITAQSGTMLPISAYHFEKLPEDLNCSSDLRVSGRDAQMEPHNLAHFEYVASLIILLGKKFDNSSRPMERLGDLGDHRLSTASSMVTKAPPHY